MVNERKTITIDKKIWKELSGLMLKWDINTFNKLFKKLIKEARAYVRNTKPKTNERA